MQAFADEQLSHQEQVADVDYPVQTRRDYVWLVAAQIFSSLGFAVGFVSMKCILDESLPIASVRGRCAVDAADDFFSESLMQKAFQQMRDSFLSHQDQHLTGPIVVEPES